MRLKEPVLVLGIFLLTAIAATAQPTNVPTGSQRQLLDGVAAVAGNDVVLVSEVMQRVRAMAQQGLITNPTDPAVQRQALNSIIDEKLVLTRASEDSITVSDEDVNRAVDNYFAKLIQRAGSERALEDAYGMPIDRLRREARDLIRQQLVMDRTLQRQFAELKVTERDYQDFYQAYRDSLPMLPEQVELQHIVLRSRPSEGEKAAAIALARAITDSIRAGGDFADFARRYSTDGSAENGGDLGFVQNGRFVKAFEDAVKKLGINDISEPVETEYGVHVIQLIDRRADEFRSRHILLPINESTASRDSLITRLKEIRARALAGESFADLAAKYSEDEETKSLGGRVGKTSPEQLPTGLKNAVTAMKEGEITEPLPVLISQSETGYHIVRLVRRIPAHIADPTEDRLQLEAMARRYKESKEYEKWVAELRKEIYWEIKTSF